MLLKEADERVFYGVLLGRMGLGHGEEYVTVSYISFFDGEGGFTFLCCKLDSVSLPRPFIHQFRSSVCLRRVAHFFHA